MKRLTVLLLAIVVLAIACDSIGKRQSGRRDVQVAEIHVTLQAELVATRTTQQSVDQIARPMSTTMPESTPEATLMAVEIGPYPGAPECSNHDETKWHGLWNAEEGCHYDHTHNADPFVTEFGDRVAAWDQSISYAWQTSHENTMKHQGYKYAYISDPDCSEQLDKDNNCIRASLIQLHAIGSQMDMTVRFHSYRAIALISEGVSDEPGLIELGGHSDFGILHCPYKKEHCPLSNDPPDSNFDLMRLHPPYRASTTLDRLERDLANGRITHAWNSGWQPSARQFYPTPYNLLFEYDFHSIDAWGAINGANPTELHLLCPNGDCSYNHSTLRIYEIVIRIPEELAGADGRVNFIGFTDVQGNIDDACTEIGPNCVPLIIENVPPGLAKFNLPVSNIPITAFPDYDIYFDGETSGWIQYPN